ncbi:rRNA maturation RNase YbeY [Buchnera aphidicola]|uniref:rRNA maturation RNase YbeY n=1 Tax=Buchnera aphidicola TaxID=9 RepID=UPI003464D8BA
MKNIKLNLKIKIKEKNIIPKKCKIQQWIQNILHKKCEITICIVNKKEIQKINFTYRNKNQPTNILSFPYQIPKYTQSYLIGDLVICAEIMQKEILEQNKTLESHWAHIIIHGILHLLGYQHKNQKKKNKMEKIEIDTMKKLGYGNPYILK